MMELFYTIATTSFFVTVIRTSTPLILATLGGLIADLSGAMNIALEGMMLTSCLSAVIISSFAPWYVGVAGAVLTGAFFGAMMGFFHLRLKADIILVGLAINILAIGGTVFVLSLATGGDKGTSINLISKAAPAVDLTFLAAIPGIGSFLSGMLSGHSILSWATVLILFMLWYFLYHMPQGLWLRGVGEYPAAPEAAGIPVRKVQLYSLVASGALAGLGGAQLAMFNYVGFTREMTSGRGFIALGAVLLGSRHPIGAMWAALLFGFFEALSVVMPTKFATVPAEAINSIPFAVTVLALFLFSYRAQKARRLSGAPH